MLWTREVGSGPKLFRGETLTYLPIGLGPGGVRAWSGWAALHMESLECSKCGEDRTGDGVGLGSDDVI